MVEQTTAKLLTQEGMPTLMVNERAVLDCGCHVWIGLRTDNREVATACIQCSPQHTPLMEKFRDKLLASLDEPTTRKLVDVCDELLEEAAQDGD